MLPSTIFPDYISRRDNLNIINEYILIYQKYEKKRKKKVHIIIWERIYLNSTIAIASVDSTYYHVFRNATSVLIVIVNEMDIGLV